MTQATIGRPLARTDGPAKVTGQARYAADFNRPNQVHAVAVCSKIGLGRITNVNHESAASLPGVLVIISHMNAPRLPYLPHKAGIDPAQGERLHVLQDATVRFYGQPVAVIVAETLDQAERAAAALHVSYERADPIVQLHHPAAQKVRPSPAGRLEADYVRGSPETAFNTSEVKIDLQIEIARQHHHPMEPHATVASWQGDRLTVWSKTQFVANEQAEIASIFGIPRDHVQVLCPYVGGAFGTSLRTWPHVTLAAIAARAVGRPTKLVLTRRQMTFITGYRPTTHQRLAVGADKRGRLTSIIHEGTAETSRYEEYVEALTSATDFMYSCANVRTTYRLKPLDVSTPTYMRGPGEAPGIHALETALDELAYKVGLDPIELRRRNEPSFDEGAGRPFSSRSLLKCYDLGAEKFAWNKRDPSPRAMKDGRLFVGMGTATATYPALQFPASARARLLADNTADIEAAASDMGPGTYTSLTQIAADALGLPVDRVRFRLGNSDYPPTPPHGGSQTLAAVGTAVHEACVAAQNLLAKQASRSPTSPFHRVDPSAIAWIDGTLKRNGEQRGMTYGELVASLGGKPIEAESTVARDPNVAQRYSMHAFGAVFVEVSVDPDVGIVRVRRALGVYAAGRIINPRLATSQCLGGMIGGIGMALMERTALDPRDGRPTNAQLAEYLLPVNLDIPALHAEFVDEVDRHVNPLGVKGLGEIALVGMAPAIANAIYHATGRRIRELPIRIEHLLNL